MISLYQMIMSKNKTAQMIARLLMPYELMFETCVVIAANIIVLGN